MMQLCCNTLSRPTFHTPYASFWTYTIRICSCGIIITYNNVNLQITREPMVLPCWYWKSCHGEVLETCSPSLVYFHKVEESSSWYLREMEDKRALLSVTWPLHPRCRFDSCQLRLVIDACVWVFLIPSFWLWEDCRWYNESSYFY